MLASLGVSDKAADLIALLSLLAAIFALHIAWRALRRADLSSSAATLLSLNEAYREAWARFLGTEEANRQYEFSELMNLIEIGAAIYIEKALTGAARELHEEYLRDVLKIIENHTDARNRIEEMRHSSTTFKYTKKFMKNIGWGNPPKPKMGHKLRSLIGLPVPSMERSPDA